jgi:hypothetical protein
MPEDKIDRFFFILLFQNWVGYVVYLKEKVIFTLYVLLNEKTSRFITPFCFYYCL